MRNYYSLFKTESRPAKGFVYDFVAEQLALYGCSFSLMLFRNLHICRCPSLYIWMFHYLNMVKLIWARKIFLTHHFLLVTNRDNIRSVIDSPYMFHWIAVITVFESSKCLSGRLALSRYSIAATLSTLSFLSTSCIVIMEKRFLFLFILSFQY